MFLLNWVPLLLLVGETIPCHNILIIMFACSFFKCCCTAWDLKFVFYYLYPMLFLSSLTASINCRLQYLNLLLVVSSSIFYWAYARFDLLPEWWAWNFPLSLSLSWRMPFDCTFTNWKWHFVFTLPYSFDEMLLLAYKVWRQRLCFT